MTRDSLPKVQKLIETARAPRNPENILGQVNQTEIYNAIISFYRNQTDIPLRSYRLADEDSSYETDTTLFVPSDTVDISNLYDMNLNYSNYSYDGLEHVALDVDEVWNGESSIIVYEDDKIKFGKTDYYTSRIFSRLLYIESAKALVENNHQPDNIQPEDLPLRESMLRTKGQVFDTDSFSTGGASGGVMVGKRDGKWRILLGKRSQKPRINQGLISIAPNGGVEYEDLQDEGFSKTMRREFSEEIIPEKDNNFYHEHVEERHVTTGWNMRGGTMAVGYALFLEKEGYKKIYESKSTNFEFSELVEIDVRDYESVAEIVKMDKMSPSTIPTVLETIKLFNQDKELPSIPYEIESIDS